VETGLWKIDPSSLAFSSLVGSFQYNRWISQYKLFKQMHGPTSPCLNKKDGWIHYIPFDQSIHPPIYTSIYSSIHPPIYPSTHLSIHPPINPSTHLSIHPATKKLGYYSRRSETSVRSLPCSLRKTLQELDIPTMHWVPSDLESDGQIFSWRAWGLCAIITRSPVWSHSCVWSHHYLLLTT
jgi:hypothetical protein